MARMCSTERMRAFSSSASLKRRLPLRLRPVLPQTERNPDGRAAKVNAAGGGNELHID